MNNGNVIGYEWKYDGNTWEQSGIHMGRSWVYSGRLMEDRVMRSGNQTWLAGKSPN